MKRYLPLLLCCLFLLAGCGQKTDETGKTAEDIVSAVAESQSVQDLEGLTGLSGEVLTGFLQSCGLENWEEAAVRTGEGMDAREITVILLHDEEAAQAAAACLEEHRRSRILDFFGYAPEQAELLQSARVLTRGRWAAFLACPGMEAAETAFAGCFEGGVEVLEPVPVPDTSGFVPFDPPNAVDMTLYDDTAVVRAWRTGDETGLSGMDRTILSRCRAVFDEVITQGMTDFEKELALHDWLIANGAYDAQSRSNPAHIGQPHNTDPYGMLEGGYGICLGFATTFQLLMDLAEVECITVVGAAYSSGQDHAWNMVRLDGEWYCVDVTWDNSGEAARGDEDPNWYIHQYFNVTSDAMRLSDHQWDYETVPEATATRYRWNGVDELPA